MSEIIDLFDCVSPLDYRYYGRNKRLVKELSEYFSENAKTRFQARVEAEYARVLALKGIIPRKSAKAIVSAALRVRPQEVYREEERIKHDIKALVNCIRDRLGDREKPFVHLGLTSYDVVDTANSLRFKKATERVILPRLKRLERVLIRTALRERNTIQIGRTHGRFAEPITFGFALAEFVERIGERILAIERAKNNLNGKLSGSVGAMNALSLISTNTLELEKELMKRLGLKRARHSTQIMPREPMLDLTHSIVSAFGVLANLADDLRHLQRSEIAEVFESFGKKQVGSSTMPQKQNPVSLENIKSFWKAFMPRVFTLYLDQISEHQRDLTNSASARFTQEIFVGFLIAVDRMEQAFTNLRVDRKKMKENFGIARKELVGEPLYVLLAKYCYPNAHEKVRRLALKAAEKKKTIMQAALESRSLKPFLKRFSRKEMAILKNPELYTGTAVERTERVCRHWRKQLKL